MIFAADYPFLQVMATMTMFFLFVAWLIMVIVIISDVFRRPDLSGWGTALWCAGFLFLPVIGTFVYLVIHHDGMAQRHIEREHAERLRVDEQLRSLLGADAQPDVLL